MEISGRPNEGWIMTIPLTVFVLVVVFALGGPTAFLHTIAQWAGDLLSALLEWLSAL